MVDLPFAKTGTKKLLIFDLDETLAHCVRKEKSDSPSDVYLPITMKSGRQLNPGFNIRPQTRELLEFANKHFEVAVFTASHKFYADVVIDYIDPEGTFFQHRLY